MIHPLVSPIIQFLLPSFSEAQLSNFSQSGSTNHQTLKSASGGSQVPIWEISPGACHQCAFRAVNSISCWQSQAGYRRYVFTINLTILPSWEIIMAVCIALYIAMYSVWRDDNGRSRWQHLLLIWSPVWQLLDSSVLSVFSVLFVLSYQCPVLSYRWQQNMPASVSNLISRSLIHPPCSGSRSLFLLRNHCNCNLFFKVHRVVDIDQNSKPIFFTLR